MEFLGHIGQFGTGALGYLIPFLFVLTLVVFVHELGHFLVARWCGVSVKAFSIGFGPELVGFNDRHGTRWKISAIPLGGYVKFLGDEDGASTPDRQALDKMSDDERRDTFFGKSVWQRAAIVAAGPIANFILAIAIFAAIFTIYGRETTTARVDQVVAGSAADIAGFKPGDLILEIGGSKIESFNDLQRIVSTSADLPLTVLVQRGGSELTLQATPARREVTDRFGNVHRIGQLGLSRDASAANVKVERFALPQAILLGAKETWFVVDRTFAYIGGIFSGRESADELGGPIRVAQVSGQVATLGFVALVNLAAVLSVSIGLLNLFPVPMLDGGHLLFYAIEAVRGRPLSARAQDLGFRIGLAAVVMLMIFTTWNDIMHLTSL
ncbi:RIP metalloprotease RseP [Kaistia dalseonensis]|uniref:Zinc metalloprotease n=1 Tax=Kaistia dalseonensis TaxID=410840 RepID=A0ABU0H3D3_9HYPH|nr:RIP metalloprotease RseP [Kaistia dalseonensis]MCX5493427.1 RIP metalloprotease RseP [Kaistia dalseonensis]MDQ0435986.1 regulator of sigma E protease [Kaistia dalseonensis]